jgi:hypothetical protein
MPLLRPSQPPPEPALDYQPDRVRNGGIYDLGCRGRVDLGSLKLCVSDAGLARMRSYDGKKITSPNRSFEV